MCTSSLGGRGGAPVAQPPVESEESTLERLGLRAVVSHLGDLLEAPRAAHTHPDASRCCTRVSYCCACLAVPMVPAHAQPHACDPFEAVLLHGLTRHWSSCHRGALQDVRVDTKLNKFLWSQGIKGVPGRVRVRLARKRNDDEEAAEKLYTLCMHVPVEKYQYKGLVTTVVEE